MSQDLHIHYQTFASPKELEEDEMNLLEKALEATEFAYAPYSKFQVGCAILLADGEIITGNNQENIAFPSGLCAERTALFYCGAQGKAKGIRKIAIRAKSVQKPILKPVTPCGACRQVMLEYERLAENDTVVLMQGENGDVLRVCGVAKTLLPFSFDIEF